MFIFAYGEVLLLSAAVLHVLYKDWNECTVTIISYVTCMEEFVSHHEETSHTGCPINAASWGKALVKRIFKMLSVQWLAQLRTCCTLHLLYKVWGALFVAAAQVFSSKSPVVHGRVYPWMTWHESGGTQRENFRFFPNSVAINNIILYVLFNLQNEKIMFHRWPE